MQVAVGAISHETNTFADGRTGLKTFSTATGADLLTTERVGRSIRGIVDELERADVDIHPTVGASALPAPTVAESAFEWMREELVSRLDGEPVDGVCLDLHGSMFVEGEPDPEGALLEAVRETVGEAVPITAALDMHATITERMVANLDGVAGYRTAPHTDVTETGTRATKLLLADLRGDASLTLEWERLPMLLAGEQSETEAEPMCSLVSALRDADDTDGIHDANFFFGFPWADSPYAGCHALVTGDASMPETVAKTTTELAREFWRKRRAFDFSTDAYDPSVALESAVHERRRPVVISDTGDIPGAGASEDTTNLLSMLCERSDLGPSLFAVVADEPSYGRCRAAGETATVRLELGRTVPENTASIVDGTVSKLVEVDGVGTALVSLDGGVDVLVADTRTNLHRDPEFLHRFDVAPDDYDCIVLKSGYLSPAWKTVSARELFALTLGDTNQQLADLPYERIPRPTFPLDEHAEWQSRKPRRELTRVTGRSRHAVSFRPRLSVLVVLELVEHVRVRRRVRICAAPRSSAGRCPCSRPNRAPVGRCRS